ncbi:CRISPR-associated endonuclease Cas3'' [Sphingomonas sp.]|uniref:CRISPR-associated endonuclease Cas3'' n=1 Tax=Sphingomonas sp. TaxID=28214 RepID=UPI0035BC106F
MTEHNQPYAHSRPGEPRDTWEPLLHHLRAVADQAAAFAAPFGAGAAAAAAGWLHDIGKNSAEFQRYIDDHGPSPDHSTAGAVEAARFAPPWGRLIALAVAGHHAGLPDADASFDARLTKELPRYAGWEAQAPGLPNQVAVKLGRAAASPGYSLAFLGRMIFSCLVDADFLATEAFYGERERGGHATLAELRDRLDRHMAGFAGGPRAGEPINRLRANILAHARAAAASPPGLFTMTVPTGGGKTLASLAFALDHAVAHGLDRVVLVAPYTSIIDQTADVLRAVLGDDDVLEHHGNVDWDGVETDADGREALAKLRRASENWDVPIVVTTAVQFFESLHANRTGACRKLHNLARSVVILDEVQTLPVPLLRPCVEAIRELSTNYGASIVLCTATQPALRREDGFIDGLEIAPDRELAPDPKGLYHRLRRVTVEHVGEVDDAAIAARFAEQPQLLCIVNSRKHAQMLFGLIADQPGARHLTTLMCPAHRRQVLAETRGDLAAGRPVRLVATSLIEAGVDVDFPEAWRAETGLDSIAQTAGRVNREGKRDTGRVVIFAPADQKPPAAFAQPTGAMRAALRLHGDDPLGLAAIHAYFTELYWTKGDEALDAATIEGERFPILQRLKDSFSIVGMDQIRLAPPYAGIARAFRIIDDVMDPVIVPWRGGAEPGEVENLLAALRAADRPPASVLRRLQRYTVSIPTKARARMLASGAVQPVDPRYGDDYVHLAIDSLYSERTGLSLDEFGMEASAGIF